jgi:hypothetical protein
MTKDAVLLERRPGLEHTTTWREIKEGKVTGSCLADQGLCLRTFEQG